MQYQFRKIIRYESGNNMVNNIREPRALRELIESHDEIARHVNAR